MGIGLAIYKDLPQIKNSLQYLGKSFALSSCFFGFFDFFAEFLIKKVFNEFFNGIVKRNYGKEQSFLSNTASAIVTFSIYYSLHRNIRNLKKIKLK